MAKISGVCTPEGLTLQITGLSEEIDAAIAQARGRDTDGGVVVTEAEQTKIIDEATQALQRGYAAAARIMPNAECRFATVLAGALARAPVEALVKRKLGPTHET